MIKKKEYKHSTKETQNTQQKIKKKKKRKTTKTARKQLITCQNIPINNHFNY